MQGTQAGGCMGSSGHEAEEGPRRKVWTRSPGPKGYALGRGEEQAKYKEPLSRCLNDQECENLIMLLE